MSFKFGNRRPGANAKAALMPEITVGKEEGGNSRSALPKKKSPRNRSTKTSISFDPQKRRDFLTGFRRRKEERRKKAREQIHKDAKEEVKKAREDAKKRAKELSEMRGGGGTSSSHRVLPEIQHLLPKAKEEEEEESGPTEEVSDFGSHTVSITHLGGADKEEEAEEGEEEGETAAAAESKKIQRMANRIMQKRLLRNKAFLKAKKLKDVKEAKKSKKAIGKKTAKTKRNKHHHPKKITT